jgi:hypothetical protein
MRYGAHYNGCLTVTANAEGLGLAVVPLFGGFHPPLFFVWSDVSTTRQPRHALLRLDFTGCPGISIGITERLAKKIHNAVGEGRPEFKGLATS